MDLWFRRTAVAVVLFVCIWTPVSAASEVDVLVAKLVEKNILTRIDADEILRDIRKAQPQAVPSEAPAKLPSIPSWLDGLKQQGDLRLRYDGIALESEDGRDRDRFRFRLRWGLEKVLNEDWKVGFRLATGTATDATSENQTLDDEFSYKEIRIDRAYGIWTPNRQVKEFMPNASFEMGGGKVANPYEKWGTSIVWDPDVNPEGVYEKMDFKITDLGDPAQGGKWELNTLLGQFVLNENSNGQDVNLLAYGIGTTVAWDKAHDARVGFVYYDWEDYSQLIKSGSVLTTVNPGGNDTEVDAFRVISLYAETNMPVPTWWGPKNLRLFGHYIHNTDEGPGAPNSGNEDGSSAGVALGKAKAKGDWEAKYQWYYLENNATPGNFSESDLGLGGTNNRGHQLQYSYRLLDALQIGGSLVFAERIDATISPAVTEDRQITRWLLDLVYSF